MGVVYEPGVLERLRTIKREAGVRRQLPYINYISILSCYDCFWCYCRVLGSVHMLDELCFVYTDEDFNPSYFGSL